MEKKEERDKWIQEGLEKLKRAGEGETEVSPPKIEEEVTEVAVAVSSTPKQEREVYRCRGKDCAFQTLELDAFIEHSLDERLKPIHDQLAKLSPPKVEAPRWEGEEPKTHKTVGEYLNCPDCYPKFEKAMLELPKFQETLKAQGYVKAKPKKKEGLTV